MRSHLRNPKCQARGVEDSRRGPDRRRPFRKVAGSLALLNGCATRAEFEDFAGFIRMRTFFQVESNLLLVEFELFRIGFNVL